MIRHVWSVLCKQVFVDPETDEAMLSLLESLPLGVLTDLAPSAIATEFDLVSLWYCDVPTGPFTYKVKATGPSGQQLVEVEVPASGFEPPKHRSRSRVRFPGVAYDGVGVYWFRVMRLVDGQEILDAEVPLQLG